MSTAMGNPTCSSTLGTLGSSFSTTRGRSAHNNPMTTSPRRAMRQNGRAASLSHTASRDAPSLLAPTQEGVNAMNEASLHEQISRLLADLEQQAQADDDTQTTQIIDVFVVTRALGNETG